MLIISNFKYRFNAIDNQNPKIFVDIDRIILKGLRNAKEQEESHNFEKKIKVVGSNPNFKTNIDLYT
jgi:hypothetical protein